MLIVMDRLYGDFHGARTTQPAARIAKMMASGGRTDTQNVSPRGVPTEKIITHHRTVRTNHARVTISAATALDDAQMPAPTMMAIAASQIIAGAGSSVALAFVSAAVAPSRA